ncbi:hypothetical protein PMAYCL1PPCAC_08682, partial [Pristionchus mayeri]
NAVYRLMNFKLHMENIMTERTLAQTSDNLSDDPLRDLLRGLCDSLETSMEWLNERNMKMKTATEMHAHQMAGKCNSEVQESAGRGHNNSDDNAIEDECSRREQRKNKESRKNNEELRLPFICKKCGER